MVGPWIVFRPCFDLLALLADTNSLPVGLGDLMRTESEDWGLVGSCTGAPWCKPKGRPRADSRFQLLQLWISSVALCISATGTPMFREPASAQLRNGQAAIDESHRGRVRRPVLDRPMASRRRALS